eukprot:jgi/Galph1/5797/GphlegSOOS_G4515.1
MGNTEKDEWKHSKIDYEKQALEHSVELSRSNLKLLKLERSFDIQKKHEKEAEEVYYLKLETELDKKISELEPWTENLTKKREQLEREVESLTLEIRFLRSYENRSSVELDEWLEHYIKNFHPTTQRLLRKSKDLAMVTWKNLLTAVDGNTLLADHVASEFEKILNVHVGETTTETAILSYLLTFVPIVCLLQFLFRFTTFAKSQATCNNIILLNCSYQIILYSLFIVFSLAYDIDPLLLLQRQYEKLFAVLILMISLSLLGLMVSFIILWCRRMSRNTLSHLVGVGATSIHFYLCVLKPALIDGLSLLFASF